MAELESWKIQLIVTAFCSLLSLTTHLEEDLALMKKHYLANNRINFFIFLAMTCYVTYIVQSPWQEIKF